MDELIIVHTADWHLRDAHMGLTSRSDDFFQAALSPVTTARQLRDTHPAAEVIMVVCGDLLNAARPSAHEVKQLDAINNALLAADLKAYCIIGNHDLASPPWPTQLRSWSATKGLQDITNKTEVHVAHDFAITLHGLPPCPSFELPARLDALQVPDGLNLVLWHGMLKDHAGYPVEKMLSIEDLSPHLQRFGALLMGDVHKPHHQMTGSCFCSMPGATELCNRMEPLQHSCTVLHWQRQSRERPWVLVKHELRPTRHVPAFAVRIDDEDGLDAAVQRLNTIREVHDRSLVFVSYAPGLAGVLARLYGRIDLSTMILRAAPDDATCEADNMWWLGMSRQASGLQSITLEAMMQQCLGPHNAFLDLGTRLCAQNARVGIEIDRAVAERLKLPAPDTAAA